MVRDGAGPRWERAFPDAGALKPLTSAPAEFIRWTSRPTRPGSPPERREIRTHGSLGGARRQRLYRGTNWARAEPSENGAKAPP